MFQEDVERGQEFRKCIECFMCQDVCHVIRDHEDNKTHYAGPRFFIRYGRTRDASPRFRTDRPRPSFVKTWTWILQPSPSAAPRSAPSTSRSPTTRYSVEGTSRRTLTTTQSRGSGAKIRRKPKTSAADADVSARTVNVSAFLSDEWFFQPE